MYRLLTSVITAIIPITDSTTIVTFIYSIVSVKLKTKFLYFWLPCFIEMKQDGTHYSESDDHDYEYPERIVFLVALVALDSITPVTALPKIHLAIVQIIE
jgi:ribonucleotide reductase beta subunit family protein with ferritin-like domain